ncbi:hypothetical protein ABKV19_007848 [Rosa sericea]
MGEERREGEERDEKLLLAWKKTSGSYTCDHDLTVFVNAQEEANEVRVNKMPNGLLGFQNPTHE